ncbi:MAG: DUF4238 domain-containing protein, partial [Terriglobia bacterium]
LYSLDGYPPEYRQAIEKQFMGPIVDEPASRALDVLLERNLEKLTPELRSAWTRFLMATRVRNPEAVAELTVEARRRAERALLADPDQYLSVKRPHDPATLLEWAQKHAAPRIENAGKFVLTQIAQNEKIGNAIIGMRWATLDFSASDIDLLTSDRPLIMTHGLGDQRCVISFPLSPRLAFFATYDPKQEQRILRHTITQIAKSLNQSVVGQAHRHVYGASRSHLRFVENRLRRQSSSAPSLISDERTA